MERDADDAEENANREAIRSVLAANAALAGAGREEELAAAVKLFRLIVKLEGLAFAREALEVIWTERG
jgi:hypothetical protein